MKTITIIAFFLSCNLNSQIKSPQVIESIKESASYFESSKKNSWEREPIYIGNFQKEIINKMSDNRIEIIKNHYENSCQDNYVKREKDSFKNFLEGKVNIYVDTNQKLKFYKVVHHQNELNTFEYFYANPVVLKNSDSQDVQIGYGFYIPLIMQAQKKNGEWKDIEDYYVADCGTCLNMIYFKPNEIVVTTSVIYKGDFETKLRLRLGDNNFSNVFTGKINKSQIE